MRCRAVSCWAVAALALVGAPTLPPMASAESRPPGVMNGAEIELALHRLRVLGSVLYVAAHPDDENTALITYLSKGRRMRVGYLSMTRGSGGQNLLGSEAGEALGVIRTQELLAARAIDGAEQYFTRAIDFGYSKTADETMAIWGQQKILSDVVWVIRNFRPDVIVTRFPPDTRGGHGHHQASAMLAKEAFVAAADPKQFPEQLRTVRPWRAQRILWNVFRLDSTMAARTPPLLTIDLGTFDPLLGKSYTEVSAASRSMHKTQGFGAAERRGPVPNYFELLAGEPATGDLLDGAATGWSRIQGGDEVDATLATAEREFDPNAPQRILPLLARAHEAIGRLGDDPWVGIKRRELEDVMRSCAGLWIEAIAERPFALPGGDIRVALSILNRSDAPVQLLRVEMPYGASARSLADTAAPFADRPLKRNTPFDGAAILSLPRSIGISEPYWLRSRPTDGAYEIADRAPMGKAESLTSLSVRFDVEIEGTHIAYDTPVLFRWTDRVLGERYRPLEIVPPVTLRFERNVYLFPDETPREVRVVVESPGPAASGPVRLTLPRGWRVAPAETTIAVTGPDDPATLRFWVTPPRADGGATMEAFMTVAGTRQARSRTVIDYSHVPVTTLFPEASARLVRAEVRVRGAKVGYVMGSGDEIPAALEQMGYTVTLLNDGEVESSALGEFDAIVVGIRAYNTRTRLRAMRDQLLAYVADGGSLIVQYNTSEDAIQNQLGPYPFQISRGRVTVEAAPVRFQSPEHPLLRTPNRITASDFDGWVQERGLYFASPWDPKYETILSMNDPDEPPLEGSTLYARYGKGCFIYTGISWFRQLPAGVPGAYRLFANLVGAAGE